VSLCNKKHPAKDGLVCTKPAHPFGMHAHDPSGTYWEGEPVPSPQGNMANKILMAEIATNMNRLPSDNADWISDKHPATAQMAKAKFQAKSGSLRKKVYDAILDSGSNGLTDDEIETFLARSHQSASGARNTLMNDGWVVDSGQRRETRYGNPAIAWIAVTSLPVQ
jgi:hypothetical protein